MQMEYDGYIFHIHEQEAKNPTAKILGWYEDRAGELQFIHRKSIYGEITLKYFNTQIFKTPFRTLALALLHDEEGISEAGYDAMCDLLEETGNRDIKKYVDACNGRFFIDDEAAKTLRNIS